MSGLSFGRIQSGHFLTADEASRTSGILGLGVTLTMRIIEGVGSMCLVGQLRVAMDNGHATAFATGLDLAITRALAR